MKYLSLRSRVYIVEVKFKHLFGHNSKKVQYEIKLYQSFKINTVNDLYYTMSKYNTSVLQQRLKIDQGQIRRFFGF